ncbi:MAG: hypothetical protein BZY80_06480 [SAR202 cluster bacterium Io17-Chloro-G2]|nr:MAG: hypothetical protein BZY80_06480 [SAR202 cluster bacterium Io17-Chloro-G2]
MRRHHREIEDRNGAVLAVSFESSERISQLFRQMQLPFPILSDPRRDTYRAYGLASGNLLRLWAPGTIWTYIKLLARGNWYHFGKSDLRQMGGDFVLDQGGLVAYEFRGASPHQRPTVSELLAVLDRI